VNIAYRWFLGYSLLDEIPHFTTVNYAFCKRFPPEVSEEIFAHILNKALNHRMVDPSMIFIDGTHIKASANKKKFQKEQVARTAKVYEEKLRKEVAEERQGWAKRTRMMIATLAAAPEGVLLKKQYPGCILPNPNAPGQRTFSRCAAAFFLEIRQYSCEKKSCSAQKLLAAGHIASWKNTP